MKDAVENTAVDEPISALANVRSLQNFGIQCSGGAVILYILTCKYAPHVVYSNRVYRVYRAYIAIGFIAILYILTC